MSRPIACFTILASVLGSAICDAQSLQEVRARHHERGTGEAALVAYQPCKAGQSLSCVQASIYFLLDGQAEIARELVKLAPSNVDIGQFSYERNLLSAHAAKGRLALTPELLKIAALIGHGDLTATILEGAIRRGRLLKPLEFEYIADLCAHEETRDRAGKLLARLPSKSVRRIEVDHFADPKRFTFDFSGCVLGLRDGALQIPIHGWARNTAKLAYGDLAFELDVLGFTTGRLKVDAPWARGRIVLRRVPADLEPAFHLNDRPITAEHAGDTFIVYVPAGEGTIGVEATERGPWHRDFSVRNAETLTLDVRLAELSPSWRPVLGWSGAALAVTGGVLSGLGGLKGSSARRRFTASLRSDGLYPIGSYAQIEQEQATANRLLGLGVGIGAAGIVAIATAIVHKLSSDSTPPEWKQ